MPKFFTFTNSLGKDVTINISYIRVFFVAADGRYLLYMVGDSAEDGDHWPLSRADYFRLRKLVSA